MSKKGEFGFVWIFALIIGGAILFFAIYGAIKAGDTQRFQTDSASAKELTTLTDPLHAGFAEGSYGAIIFNQETRIYNNCVVDKNYNTNERTGFGRNEIAVSAKSTIGNEWNLPGVASQVHNKYLFSKNLTQGTTFYVFSKPWKLPYEVADLIMISPHQYCFRSVPDNIKEELEGLQIPNIAIEDCTDIENNNPLYVCFGGGTGNNCDIIVSTTDGAYEYGYITKVDGRYYYQGNLLYAAIFSDYQTYECNVERLLYRNMKIAETFKEKAELMDARGCGSNLGTDLTVWINTLKGQRPNVGMGNLANQAETMENKNRREVCGLWR